MRDFMKWAGLAFIVGIGSEIGRYVTFGLMVKWFGFGGY